MIYLTFDSNIWIYTLDESWQIENKLDYLEPWIQRGEVKLLLPQMIIDEWNKHERIQVAERRKKLHNFFRMAEEILPSAFFAEYKEPAVQKKIINDQLARAKKLIFQSEKVPHYSVVKDRILKDGIAKKAPLHKKSSIADAIIVFSLIHYAKLNQGNHYFFVSNNTTDFYEKENGKNVIHRDLKPEFENNNIQAFTTLNNLISVLQTDHGLKIDKNIFQRRKERIRNKIKEKVYNPEYDKLLESGESSYIQNINTIEFILKEKRPTKEQVIFVLALLDTDVSYERDFYKRLNKSSWFKILRQKGVYDPKNNPVPIQEKENFQIPLWNPILYLVNLSKQIKDGQEHFLIDDIIEIITSVSQKPAENKTTWYCFIMILVNLPNEKISIEILNFIPLWLKASSSTNTHCLEICENLLPKFLADNPTKNDIAKAELILKHLFSLEKVEIVNENSSGLHTQIYQSISYVDNLSHDLIDKKLTTKIVTYCSNQIIIDLADSIKKLDFQRDIYYQEHKAVDVFSVIFRDLLNGRVKHNTEAGLSLLKLFSFGNEYRLTFFRKVVLFVIRENWKICKHLFWEILKNNDVLNLFSNPLYYKDIYELLNKNQMLFSKEETEILQRIIDMSSKEEKDEIDPKYQNYWKLRWYSALRNISPFKESYKQLSQSENLTNEHYENRGVLNIRSGSVSPFSVEELLKKSNKEIATFILSFKPKRWEEPTIDGLSKALSSIVQKEPKRFSDEIEFYKDVPYIYAYYIATGFREALENKNSFNWEKVLAFFKSYIADQKFTSSQLQLENDGRGATADWVKGSVANLLSEGMQSESSAFDLSLLPIVKDILTILVPKLNFVDDFEEMNMSYPTYSLNSATGKTLRALLDYSLMRARNIKAEDNLPKWEKDIKDMLEATFRKGVIDSYILIGWHYQQFYFLDEEWTTKKIKGYYELEEKKWLAFISGFAFGNPPFNKNIYKLFYPHYERAIKNDVQMMRFYEDGIIHHIVTFYFWGFEDLQTEGLLLLLIKKGNHASILKLVNIVQRQKEYLKGLNQSEAENFEIVIFDLWKLLATKYENAKDEDEQKVLAKLSNLLVFAPELNDVYTNLVLKSIGSTNKYFHPHYLIRNFINLKDRGNSNEAAKHIGVLLNSMAPRLSSIKSKHIIDLVVFLYENNEKKLADEFCNKMAKEGKEFLIEIYNKYND